MYIQDIRTNFKWLPVKSKFIIQWMDIALENNEINYIHYYKDKDEYEVCYYKSSLTWFKGVSFDLFKTIQKCTNYWIVSS